MEYILGILAGVCFLLIWAGLTRPKLERPQMSRDEQRRLRSLRGGVGTLVATAVEDLASWFQGRATDEKTWRGGLHARYLEQLKMANWYWAPGEATPLTPSARFWNIETLWASKVLYAGLFGLVALIVMGIFALIFGWSFVAPLAIAAIAGAAGFTDPDRELADAADERRKQIVLEMGTKVPEMRSYVLAGRSILFVLRHLADRPGGPFVQELHRILAVYSLTTDVGRGLEAVIDYCRPCQPLVNLCADLLALHQEGGDLGKVLSTHADTAQHEQARLLRQQGQDNTQQMMYVVAATTLIVIFILVGAPAMWILVQSL
jgi:Flp pilus assembly protein TadB